MVNLPNLVGPSRALFFVLIVRGLPYMTAALRGGRGSPKSKRKEQNQLIYVGVHDKGGGRGSKNPKISRTSYLEAPLREALFRTDSDLRYVACQLGGNNIYSP